jgi:uncharacterized 2Fe-2S/4Fe-4S cluster protein (DUF4445 family)
MPKRGDTTANGGGDQVDVRLEPAGHNVTVAAGTLLADAIAKAGLRVSLPCGGQGRCGRCAVEVREGSVRRRSTLRLSEQDLTRGYALACQTIVNSDATIWIPPEHERVDLLEGEHKADKTAAQTFLCDHHSPPWVSRYRVVMPSPTIVDNIPDLERLQRELTRQFDLPRVTGTLTALSNLPHVIREEDWAVTAEVERYPSPCVADYYRLMDVLPGRARRSALGLAVDIGTTTVEAHLGNLSTGQLIDQASEYNRQMARGEDVISRIIYARDPKRRGELQELVIATVNSLIDEMLLRQDLTREDLTFVTVAGNTTMTHLFLGLRPDYIRLEPYVPAAGMYVPVLANRLGLHAHPEAHVDCLPGVGAYVGGDITAGVLRTGMHEDQRVTLFIDIGTNGEMVLGNSEWLISCACSAGPAFEGAGAASGVRAVKGAIDEVWIDPHTLQPTFSTLGGAPPVGICGSGMISLLGEMRVTGVIDKSGSIAVEGLSDRVRRGDNGLEYVVAWAEASAEDTGDIVLTETDIQNLLRAKASIYAGATMLCDSVGMNMSDVERVLIGGGFGRHIDVEKAIDIGLLPDLPWERFTYLGNTSIQGAYEALTCREHRVQLDELAGKMTYLELSSDNRFMEAFTSALFIPHTDESLFPSVGQALAAARPDKKATP